jgi:glycosyltransferase involved in cell wall biosynthesis
MKIAILVNFFPPKWLAGTEVATYNLADHLARRGHEVHVITSHDAGLPELSEVDGFRVHRITWPKIRFIGIVTFWAKICLKMRKIKPDIIHAQNLGVAIPTLTSARILKIPSVVWGRGSDIYLPDRFTRMTSKSILQNADTVLALTEDMEQKMREICDRDISVVPNGIDLERFKISSGDIKEGSAKTIIFVGRLHPVKGVQYLIEAMATVHQQMPDVKLIIVGDGAERAMLEELAERLNLSDCIQFAGKVPQESIPRLMHQADVFALSSLSESFGIVNLEAMAAGLPIVATKVGGIPDVVEEGVNGHLVNAKNPDELADRLLVLLQNDEMREEMSTNNREKAELYTWDKVTTKVEKEYQKAIARNIEAGSSNLQRKTTDRNDVF